MAESYSNQPPSGSHNPPPPPGAGGEDNEPRIDGDGQEVNALRFLGAGGPPAPPAPSITPVSSGVSQPLPSQQPPAPPQTPHQHQPPPSSIPSQSHIPNTPGGVGVSSYDPYSDPSGVGSGAYHPHSGGMQIPPGPMSGPYGMAAGPPGAPPGMMTGGPMMMMPSYGYGMYPSPYGFMPAAAPYPGAMAPQQPQNSQTQFLAMLNVLRVHNPKYYREWYKKYTAHKRNPDRIPFPPIPQVPGFPPMGGPGSSQTLPSFGRSRKESSRSSVNGDASYSRGHQDSFADYSSLSHVPNTSSLPRGVSGHHHRPPSGRASVNGDYKSGAGGLHHDPDDFGIDGAADPNLSMAGHLGQNSYLHSTLNQDFPSGLDSGSDRDRRPTHSGRSSTIGETYRLQPADIYGGGDQQDSLSRYDSSLYHPPYDSMIGSEQQQREPSPVRRMTPMKFSTFHCIAAMSPLGHMIRIKNSGTVLEFIKMKQYVGHLPECREMESFPGPLTQSVHKNTVIQFCKRKIKEARSNPAQLDKENYILLWEFLMLMLRQNGMVVGSDIAELLLTAVQEQKQQQLLQKQLESLNLQKEEVRDSVEGSDGAGGDSSDDKEEGEGESSGEDDKRKVPVLPKTVPSQDSLSSSSDLPSGSTMPVQRDEKKLVDEFCEHLLFGHKQDALNFAMDSGLWGHALFFASKMDERSYGHVLARFANGIPLNSPLQTLYHIMCGKQPASVTSCGDGGAGSRDDEETKTYGDWKPHLAMLLSNSGYKPEVEQRAILTLGDTLQSKHHCFAAQFCFLMGHEEFRKDSRLGYLLGYSPQKKNILEATQMTEVYEFARKLADPGFSLGVSFLQSKLDYAKRLVSYGFVQEALAYCEEITKVLGQSVKRRGGGDEVDELISLCGNTLKIAERIAVADENGTASSTWVEDLRKMAKEPGLYEEEDSSRKLSLVSSTNQEHSDQVSYTSSINQQQQQQTTPQLPPQSGDNTYDPYGGGGYNSTQAPSSVAPSDLSMAPPYNPEGGMMTTQSTEVGQYQQSDIMQQQQQQPPPQTQDNSWGNQNSSMMMNGGLHLSQPPQQSPNQQQQQNMYEPPPIPMMNNQLQSHGQDDSGYQMQQPSAMDTGYSTGGYNDKMSTAAPTINNNSWYNPYDSQPSLGGGGGAPTGHYQPNSSPVKKKSVRFEDEHQHQGGLVVEGNHGSSLGGDGGVQSVVRARIVGGQNRPTSLDLKSALKSSTVSTDRQHTHYRERQKISSSLVNGGGHSNTTSREENGTPPLADLERCSTKKEDKQYFEVEYKSTYPIDEPILQSPNLSIARPPPPQVGSKSMRLVNSKKQNSSLVCPPVNHPYPLNQLANNVATSSSSSSASGTRPRGGSKTYPVDRECCDVNQPCEDHGDFLDDVDEEEEDDEDEVDEEDDEEGVVGGSAGGGGGVRLGKLNNNDIEGVENGGYHHRHQSGQYARFENKTDNSKPPAPQSSSSNDKKAGADKKKSSKESKGGLDGGGQQEKGWFSGIFKKLTLKPNNQMILPDDKNPTIVWDDKKKQWVNTVGDGEDESAPAGPPPKDSDLMGGPPKGQGPPPMMMPNGPQQLPPHQQQQQQHPQMMMPPQQNQQQQPMMMGGGGGGVPPQYQQQQQQNSGAYQQQPQQQQNKGLPSMNPSLQQQSQQGMMQPVGGGGGGPMDNQMNPGMPSINNNNNSMNKYKLQRGRGMKGYVDVLNPNGSTTSSPAAAPMQPNHLPQGGGGGAPVPNLFIPPPMPQGGQGGDSGPVSFLTAPSPSTEDVPGQQGQENSLGQSQPPPMFNPAQYQGYPQGQ